MSILVNFEDTYGIADIVCQHFFNQVLNIGENDASINNIHIHKGLSAWNVFKAQSLPDGAESVITVYDMDRQPKSNEYNIMNESDLEENIDKLEKAYGANVKLWFVPTTFCAETICLHLLSDYSHDYSETFSRVNTAHLHTKILYDKLTSIHSDKADRKFWYIKGQNNLMFKIKHTRLFFADFCDIPEAYKNLLALDFSSYNKTLLDWLSQDRVDNTSVLLDKEQAILLQRSYYNSFINFVTSNENEITVGTHTYDLNKNYK